MMGGMINKETNTIVLLVTDEVCDFLFDQLKALFPELQIFSGKKIYMVR